MMSKTSRMMTIAAALLLLLTFAFPLWNINLWAPQYPEGLNMEIWSSKITGDVRNVNILNHYVGMKAIDENSIPELAYFPFIFGALAVFGAAAAGLRRKSLLYVWVGVMLVFAVLAFVDFWYWEYDYGHNLDPNAAMKMEDESFQPPLIGKKDMMNIVIWSLPHVGGIAFAISILLAVAAVALELRGGRIKSAVRRTAGAAALSLAALSLVQATAGCTPSGPEPIAYGEDLCHSCKMHITDRRFGAEVVTAKGKVYKFDALECMGSFLKQENLTGHKVYVPDVSREGALIPAETASFAFGAGMRGPMGAAVFASDTPENLSAMSVPREGAILKWNELRERLDLPAL